MTSTAIQAVNHYAYGANLGWLDGRGDTNNGVVIGEYVCSGCLHAANVGWIHLGNGATTANLSLGNVQLAHDGAYTVVATDALRSVTSPPATLTVQIKPMIRLVTRTATG